MMLYGKDLMNVWDIWLISRDIWKISWDIDEPVWETMNECMIWIDISFNKAECFTDRPIYLGKNRELSKWIQVGNTAIVGKLPQPTHKKDQ